MTLYESDVRNQRTGLEFIGPFALLCGCLWLLGPIVVGTAAFIGQSGAPAAPAANVTSVGESNNTPATEGLEAVDGPASEEITRQ